MFRRSNALNGQTVTIKQEDDGPFYVLDQAGKDCGVGFSFAWQASKWAEREGAFEIRHEYDCVKEHYHEGGAKVKG